jgi:hypothetical protein
MKNLRTDLPDPARTNLRAVVASIAGTLSSLSGQSTPEEAKTNLETLTASWGDLVNQLALGPEPEYRECPKCGHISMRQATLCGHCWAKLGPLDPLAPGESQDRLIASA